MKLTFLSGLMPLVKSFTKLSDGTISKTDYPNAARFTSEEVEIKNTKDIYDALVKRASLPKAPCLLTGPLDRPLKNESRRQMVGKDHKTQLLTLDLDKAPFTSAEEFLKAVGIDDVSYVWQWSSSAFVNPKEKRISGHIFMMLDKPYHPRVIKSWLMRTNLKTPVLEKHITLSSGKQALHWPLDIVVNDNGRIIFISTPQFKGMKDPLVEKKQPRIQLVPKAKSTFTLDIVGEQSMQSLKKEAAKLRDDLRQKEGLDPIKRKIKIVDHHEVQEGVGEVNSYEIVSDDGEFVRYNLNNGDSAAYWHHKANFEYLHSFKGEPSMLMKEVMPDRYRELKGQQADSGQTLSNDGDLVLCFREKRTAEYWKGLFNPEKHTLDIDKVKSKDQLFDYYLSHNVAPPTYIQEYSLVFNPTTETIVDEAKREINTFILPPALRSTRKGAFPVIQAALDSAVGVGPVQEHFLNWLACIFQYRCKTRTAWILHGTQGTGKGVLFERVIMPALGKYAAHVNAKSLKNSFIAFHEHKLMSFVDEIEVDLFDHKSEVESWLKSAIVDVNDKIHRKGVDEYFVPSFHNFVFGSNKNKPVIIPKDDRRFNVAKLQTKRWLPGSKAIDEDLPKEIPHFLHYLMTREASIDKANEIIQTDERVMIQELNDSSVASLSSALLDGNIEKLLEHMPNERVMEEHNMIRPIASAYAAIMKRCMVEPASRLSHEELQIIFQHVIDEHAFDKGKGKFTKILNLNGIFLTRQRNNGILEYCKLIQWKWSSLETRNELINAYSDKKLLRRVK